MEACGGVVVGCGGGVVVCGGVWRCGVGWGREGTWERVWGDTKQILSQKGCAVKV